jgi:proteasome lid subunit RPN8/RPN11
MESAECPGILATSIERESVLPRPFRRLVVPRDVLDALLDQAAVEAPLECCGFLAGRVQGCEGLVKARYALVNAAASAVEFVSDARSTFDATRDMERRGFIALAVYHSHPTTPPLPSRTDLARNYSPDVVNVIVSLQAEPPIVRAWWLWDSEYAEAEMVIAD